MIDTLPTQMFVFSLFSAVVTKFAVWVGDGTVKFDEKRRELQDSAVTNRTDWNRDILSLGILMCKHVDYVSKTCQTLAHMASAVNSQPAVLKDGGYSQDKSVDMSSHLSAECKLFVLLANYKL